MSSPLVLALLACASGLRINTMIEDQAYSTERQDSAVVETLQMIAEAEKSKLSAKELDFFENSGIKDIVKVAVQDPKVMQAAVACRTYKDPEKAELIQDALVQGQFPDAAALFPEGPTDPDLQDLQKALHACFLQNPETVEKFQTSMETIAANEGKNLELSSSRRRGTGGGGGAWGGLGYLPPGLRVLASLFGAPGDMGKTGDGMPIKDIMEGKPVKFAGPLAKWDPLFTEGNFTYGLVAFMLLAWMLSWFQPLVAPMVLVVICIFMVQKAVHATTTTAAP